MMRAGKDYIGAIPEYEDRRGAHLRELCLNIAAQGVTAAPEQAAAGKPGTELAVSSNQAKPTLKLR